MIREYRCDPCNAEFEEVLTQSDEIKEYEQWYPCPNCGGRATRLGISITNFNFKGGVRGESGVHGQSGVHDLDYPKLDKAVGRSADKKWTRIRQEQAVRDKIRKESGSVALAKVGDTVVPANAENLKVREMALNTYKKVSKVNSNE
jgi:putative FmdB family regulatory protein